MMPNETLHYSFFFLPPPQPCKFHFIKLKEYRKNMLEDILKKIIIKKKVDNLLPYILQILQLIHQTRATQFLLSHPPKSAWFGLSSPTDLRRTKAPCVLLWETLMVLGNLNMQGDTCLAATLP